MMVDNDKFKIKKYEIGGKTLKVVLIPVFGELEMNAWRDLMIMCPSQCYMLVEHNGVGYVLYLRWRWDDPWQAHIVKNAHSELAMQDDNAEWSEDLFRERNLYFKHDDVEQAKEKLIEIWREIVCAQDTDS